MLVLSAALAADPDLRAAWEDGRAARPVELVVVDRPALTAADLPDAANRLPSDQLGCTVRLEVGPDGTPTRVTTKSCHPDLFAAAQSIGMRYRFAPFTGQPSAGFDLRINFRGAAGPPTDVRTQSPTNLAFEDGGRGYLPVDPGTWTVRPDPGAEWAVPSGAGAHLPADRLCRLHVRVDATGAVRETAIVRCAADLEAAASAGVRATRFPISADRVSFDVRVDYGASPPHVAWVACSSPD